MKRTSHATSRFTLILYKSLVGYMGQDLISSSAANENYSMLSIPFTGVDGQNLPVTAIQVTNYAGTDYDQANNYDFMIVWDNTTCSSLSFFYCVEDDFKCWVNDGFEPMETIYPDGLHAGQSLWYLADSRATRVGPVSVTIAGAVETAPYVQWDLVSSSAANENYSMLSNPFPVAWSPNNAEQCVITNFAGTDYDQANNYDFIIVWDNTTCSSLSFFYCVEDDFKCWVNDGFEPLESVYPNGIPAGNAFWYLADSRATRDGTLSIKFINPMK